ncbi:MAG TPA: copper resistance protein CopC [Rhodospirillaceae bacterium]|nr:copper resistance protein CopC [Rhodospirillaceae bacterium]
MPTLAVLLAALLTGWLITGPAQAHALLLESQPKAGTTINAGPVDVLLRFNSRIDSLRSRLVLKDGQGGKHRLAVETGADAASLKAHDDHLGPGKYLLHWEVLSVDGHVSRGDLGFSIGTP